MPSIIAEEVSTVGSTFSMRICSAASITLKRPVKFNINKLFQMLSTACLGKHCIQAKHLPHFIAPSTDWPSAWPPYHARSCCYRLFPENSWEQASRSLNLNHRTPHTCALCRSSGSHGTGSSQKKTSLSFWAYHLQANVMSRGLSPRSKKSRCVHS